MNIEALRMGGYAAYVWPSVALVMAVLAWNVWAAARQLADARQRALRAMAAKATVKS
jgi:heme exporter protein CcmD